MRIHSKLTSRTRRIGVRVQEAVFDRIRELSASEGKVPSEWSSERLSEVARGVPSAFQRALLAEICATQDILVNLLYAVHSEGKLTKERVQQITSAAHSSKHRTAAELFIGVLSTARSMRNQSKVNTGSEVGV